MYTSQCEVQELHECMHAYWIKTPLITFAVKISTWRHWQTFRLGHAPNPDKLSVTTLFLNFQWALSRDGSQCMTETDHDGLIGTFYEFSVLRVLTGLSFQLSPGSPPVTATRHKKVAKQTRSARCSLGFVQQQKQWHWRWRLIVLRTKMRFRQHNWNLNCLSGRWLQQQQIEKDLNWATGKCFVCFALE